MTFRGRKKPESAAAILQKTFQVKHLEGKLERYEAIANWPEVIGAELAAVCYPEKIRRGNVLVLRVIDTVWVQELSLRKAEILDKVRIGAPQAMIEDVRFLTGSPHDFRKRANN